MATPEFDNLTKVFIARYDHIWKLYFSEKHDEEAFTLAAELLMEPRLSSAHEAGMHQLLACGPIGAETVKHAQEAVRIYREILQQYHDTSTMHEKACMRTKLRLAKEHLEGVLENKRKYDADIAKLMFNAQLEKAEREEQAKRATAQEDDGNPGDMLPLARDTAADAGVLPRSSHVAPGTASRVEKSSQSQSQSTAPVEAAFPRD